MEISAIGGMDGDFVKLKRFFCRMREARPLQAEWRMENRDMIDGWMDDGPVLDVMGGL